jgi:hypothetical protein
MARPKLNPLNFLKHLFAPKSNPLPTGIRARKLVGTKGRNKARLASYNRMAGPTQEILRQSGMREQYLKGEISLKDAREALRKSAVKQGVAKPNAKDKLRTSLESHVDHAASVAIRVGIKLRAEGKKVNSVNMIRNMSYLSTESLDEVDTMSVIEIRAFAGNEDNVIELPNGRRVNPLWYN